MCSGFSQGIFEQSEQQLGAGGASCTVQSLKNPATSTSKAP